MKHVWMSIVCGCVWRTNHKKSRRKLRKTYSSSERNQHQSSYYGDGRWDWRTSRCSVSRHNCQPSPKRRRFLKLEERVARGTAHHHGNDRQSWKSQIYSFITPQDTSRNESNANKTIQVNALHHTARQPDLNQIANKIIQVTELRHLCMHRSKVILHVHAVQ